LEPGHQAATKIRNEAQSALARLNAAIADAQRRIASHDMSGAAKSLEAAREIDPTSARVGDVAALLAEQTRANEPTGQGVRQRAGAPPARAERAPTQALPPPPQRRSEPAANQSTPPTEAPPAEPTAQPPRTAPAPPSAPVPAPPSTTSSAAPSPTPTPPPAVEPAPVPAKPAVDEDDVAIRNVIATYGRAIESKDLGLFRLVKPNLSREEERRLQEGFRAVTSQHVTLTILSIDRRGDRATVLVRRRDVIQAGARQQEAERQQTLTLARSRDGWVISEIR
jgi:hypothetical protein